MEESRKIFRKFQNALYNYRTHNGAEIDLIIETDMRLLGFEIKYADAPGITKPSVPMWNALSDLELAHLYVIYPGKKKYPLKENITDHQVPLLLETFNFLL